METHVHGVSTRAVDELVTALGASSGISRSEVSRICERLDESVEAFRTGRLDHGHQRTQRRWKPGQIATEVQALHRHLAPDVGT